MSAPDVRSLLAQAQAMQARLEAVQREVAQRTVEAAAGGGMVTAVASGALRILEVRIEPSLLATNDRGMLQDLVAAAVNAALSAAQQMVQQEIQRVAGVALPGVVPGGSGSG